MDKKSSRTAEALRLEALRLKALDDMEDHVWRKKHQPHDFRVLKSLRSLIAHDAPKEVSDIYTGMDTFIRENIPESLDDWLRATAWQIETQKAPAKPCPAEIPSKSSTADNQTQASKAMKTYTIVYSDLSGYVQTYTTTAASQDDALGIFERDEDADQASDIPHVIEHKVPRITICLDGDSVEGAYSDTSVELIHVYTDRHSLPRAIENDNPVMPDNRGAENLASKESTALAFNKVEVDYDPDAAAFDHDYINNPERVEAYTDAVREELS